MNDQFDLFSQAPVAPEETPAEPTAPAIVPEAVATEADRKSVV